MNFLKHVMQQLDDHSLGLLGAVLGENESRVRNGVKSAVPKILSAMVSTANVEQGRDMLWRELRDTDTTVANSFSKQMYYKDSQSLVATGHDQLDGLIGAETNRLIQSVSRESDIGSTSAKRLVGAVTPLVFASVANHQQSKRLNQTELGDVLSQQRRHLSDWERQSDHYFSSAYKNDDQNEPLFSSLPNGGTTAATATAVGSATLGMHHFRDRDEDRDEDQGDNPESDSAPTTGVQQDKPNKEFDQRSHDRRQREPIAVNPANSGFASNTPQHDQPSQSTTAGTVAAAGAAAVGTAGVAAAALTPSAQTTTENSFTSSDHHDTSTTNTYDSTNPVSGFAAADPGDSDTTSPSETYGGNGECNSGIATTHDGSAEPDANKKLWTPDTAQQRSADGTLQYADRDGVAHASETACVAGDKSEGWFHWLWWPVLILGSLLALSLMFLNTDGNNSQPSAQDDDPAVVAAADEEPASTDDANAEELAAVDESAEGTGEESDPDSGILNSSIQIAPSESEAANEGNDPFNESDMGLESADSNNEGNSELASELKKSDTLVPELTDEKTAQSSTTDLDEMPSLEGSIEVGEADIAKNETDSDQESAGSEKESESSAKEGTDSPQLSLADLGLDADEQVEELLSAIETELEEVNDEAKAKAVKESLSEHISGLEKLLADRAQWKDEIEILVDFQLEEGQKMLARAQKTAFESDAVKEVLQGSFKKLNELMKTAEDSQ